MKLPEHRYGCWHLPGGRCIPPREKRAYWTVSYLMAIYCILYVCSMVAAVAGITSGLALLWVSFPSVVTPIVGAVVAIVALAAVIHSVAKDLTR